ncbi:hypothetical protein CWR41_22750 [Cedecea lapagei]|nr:hypothetical protein CWR41_22470 [Cedecea lapagei]PKA32544.1 hypothetical protein CWR41_22750 [Cedecea lapagei]
MTIIRSWQPSFSLKAESNDITAEISRYLTSLTLIDYGATDEDPQSDSLTINLVSPTLKLPPKGTRLTLALGFGTQLVNKGVFVVDSVALQGPPRTMTITALAVPGDNTKGAGTMQSQKVRHWEGVTLGEIVSTIAKENNLTPKVSPALASQQPGYLDQYNENDAEFLARLARQFGAVSKAGGGCWIFAERGSGISPGGNPLPALTITPTGQTHWQFIHRSKSRTKSRSSQGKGKGTITVSYTDATSGKTSSISSGSGDPHSRPGYTFPNRTAAERYIQMLQGEEVAADAVKEEGKEKKSKKPKPEYLMSMSVTMPATPELMVLTPECKITTDGFDEQADREWLVENVAFHLEPESGMSISMELRR